jgi:hypothetical protein
MSHWSVLVGGKTVYRGKAKPTERPDGRLELPTGQTFAKGKYRVLEHKGDDPPEISGKGSVPPKPGRPDKKNPPRGFGEDNIQ